MKTTHCDVALIGAGIMSATLATLLKELQPNWDIRIFERLDRVAGESSDAWNNAGTGHSAFCELNYTPEHEGSVDCSKAYKICESFEQSKQFWSYLIEQGMTDNPGHFIHSVPHISLVWGEEDVEFLRKRWEAMRRSHLFSDMEFSDDRDKLVEWIPLIMEDRPGHTPVAATRMPLGTDVNFGALTHLLFDYLKHKHGVEVQMLHEAQTLHEESDGRWRIRIEHRGGGEDMEVHASFVFLGAGGRALTLLDKSDIPEGQGYGGFPVSGQWLICQNQALVEKHHAKVYGKASVGTPPMSVPHLDTRVIDGKKALLFGPFAGFTTKFLKEGSVFDLPGSIDLDNITAMLGAWVHNLPLTRYLIRQVLQSEEDRLDALREFIPDALADEWKLATAGYRVQVIKKDEAEGGVLEFGTEIVHARDNSLAALLGASPGASTAVHIMLDLLEQCFSRHFNSPIWQSKLREMIPSFGSRLTEDADLTRKVRKWTGERLGLRG